MALYVTLTGKGAYFDRKDPECLRFDLGTMQIMARPQPTRPALYRTKNGTWIHVGNEDDTMRETPVEQVARLFAECPMHWSWKPGVEEVKAGDPLPVTMSWGEPPCLVTDLVASDARLRLSVNAILDASSTPCVRGASAKRRSKSVPPREWNLTPQGIP